MRYINMFVMIIVCVFLLVLVSISMAGTSLAPSFSPDPFRQITTFTEQQPTH